jgi:DNA modification methylase
MTETMKMIKLFNEDNLEGMKRLPDESIDVVCIDPPYLYLKNQKLEKPFDELKFFSECKRLLTKNGFIVMFGRGTSFYRWNTILEDLGFNFKEEIIWDKRYSSSPYHSVMRTHETISVFAKDSGVINKVKVPYTEQKGIEIESIIGDVKRIKSLLKNKASLQAVEDFLESNKLIFTESTAKKQFTTTQSHKHYVDRNVSVFNMFVNGCSEKTVITTVIDELRNHYSSIHPTQKPVRLIERLLALVIPQNKPRNEIVVADFFAGSMSCMEAVHNMGMRGLAWEIDKEYFEDGRKRIESLKSKQAELFDEAI